MTSQISLIKPYLLDTNVFIAAQRSYYPLSLCPGFWDVLTHYSQQGRVLSIDRVRNEILNGDELASWVRQAPTELFLTSAEQQVVDAFSKMQIWVQHNDQFLQAAKDEFATVADGWVAAYAMVHDAIVVTQEIFQPEVKKRVPIPNLCWQFNVEYYNTFKMLHDFGVRFEWNPP